MTNGAPIDPLAHTCEAFVEQASARGVTAADAIDRYRGVFRSNRAIDWAAPVEPPVARLAREGDTVKFAVRLRDGLEPESVILPQESRAGRLRTTLCVSSQVGCARGCTFCETAQMGLLRNLAVEEILAQWHTARFRFGAPITNVVFMGMGEPMDNLDAVIHAVRVLIDANGAALAASRISISTVGKVPGILRLAKLVRTPGLRRLRLAVSLNASNDEVRSSLMPINRTAPMDRLMDAMLTWHAASGRDVLVEYVLIPGVNDAAAHAKELSVYLRPLPCTLNVIPYNPRRNSPWPAPTEATVDHFVRRLAASGQRVTRRRTLGRDAMAACGQLGGVGGSAR